MGDGEGVFSREVFDGDGGEVGAVDEEVEHGDDHYGREGGPFVASSWVIHFADNVVGLVEAAEGEDDGEECLGVGVGASACFPGFRGGELAGGYRGKDIISCGEHAEDKHEDEDGDFDGSKEVVKDNSTLAPNTVDEASGERRADSDAPNDGFAVRMVDLARCFQDRGCECDRIHSDMAEENESNAEHASGEEGGLSEDVFKLGIMLVLAPVVTRGRQT